MSAQGSEMNVCDTPNSFWTSLSPPSGPEFAEKTSIVRFLSEPDSFFYAKLFYETMQMEAPKYPENKPELDASTGVIHFLSPEDTRSEYFSAQSTAAETLISQTDSTGMQSQYGATWREAMTVTVNSGFASGTPRAEGWKGVREGRERGVGLPKVTSVGRIGRPPPPVPQEMIQAMRVQGLKQMQEQEPLVMPEGSGFTEKKDDGGHSHEGCVSFDSHSQETPNNNYTANFRMNSKEEFDNELKRRGAEIDWTALDLEIYHSSPT